MALRIGDYVVEGELLNTNRNSVHGCVRFDSGAWVRFSLAGNFPGELEGKHLRFHRKSAVSSVGDNATLSGVAARTEPPECIQALALHQIGMVGVVEFKQVRVPTVPMEQLTRTSGFEIKDCLYLEWYSQNGRVVAEIIDVAIEFVDEADVMPDATELPDDTIDGAESGPGISITRVEFDDEGSATMDDVPFGLEEPSDEYGLFDSNIEQQIQQSLSETSDARDESFGGQCGSGSQSTRSWDEVIPGIDPETKAQYESWDEIYGGKHEIPVSELFDPPIQFPPSSSVYTDDDAYPHLHEVVTRLALLNVAIDFCEHCSPLHAYRLLVDDILPGMSVHPTLGTTDIIVHYSMWEYCDQCAE